MLNKLNVELKIFYLMIFLSFLGSSISFVNIAGISLIPYRILLILLIVFFIYERYFSLSIYLKVKEYFLFFIIWIVYSLLFLNLSIDQVNGIRYISYLFIYFLLLICFVNYIKNIQQIKTVFNIWILFLVITIVVAIWEINTGQHLSVSRYNKSPELIDNIPTTFYTNPNDYATFLSISFPFLLFFIGYSKKIYLKLFFLLISFIIAFLILFTGSRANIISISIAFILYFILSNRKFRIKTFIVLAFIMLISAIYFQDIFNNMYVMLNTNLVSLFNPAERSADGSNIIRMNLIYNSIDFLSQTYGFGVGAGNAEAWMGKYAIYDTRGITNPHNWWIEILVDYGLLIFVFYIIIYMRLVYQLFVVFLRSKDANQKEIAKVLLVSLLTFVFACISSSSVMAFMPQWILLIMSISFINITKLKKGQACT